MVNPTSKRPEPATAYTGKRYAENMISDLTYKILAESEYENISVSEYINWATELIEQGHESPNLLILAACNKDSSFFSIQSYIDRSIDVPGLSRKTGEEGILWYSYYYIRKIANNVDVRNNLCLLYKFLQYKKYEGILYDFYLLYWAWDQSDYYEAHNHYWPNASKKNIENIVIQYANNWLNNNKLYYTQQPL